MELPGTIYFYEDRTSTIVGSQPIVVDLSKECRDAFDSYLYDKHISRSYDERSFSSGGIDIVKEANDFSRLSGYTIDIAVEERMNEFGQSIDTYFIKEKSKPEKLKIVSNSSDYNV